ncbi:hypothetical protein D3C73_1453820 [compost metagenome]
MESIGARLVPANRMKVYSETAIALAAPPSWPTIAMSEGTLRAMPLTKHTLNTTIVIRECVIPISAKLRMERIRAVRNIRCTPYFWANFPANSERSMPMIPADLT